MTPLLRTLTRHGRRAGLGLALAGSLLLTACGGGDSTPATAAVRDNTTVAARTVSTAAVAVIPQASVVGLTKLSETRIGRTVYDYVFRVTIASGSAPLNQVTATLTGVGAGSSIMDGVVQTGPMAASTQVTPASDTIRIRHDRAVAFNPAALVWNLVAVPVPTGTVSLVVKDVGGAFLSGAQVTLGGQTGSTDAQGQLRLTGVLAGTETVVQVRRSGFVTQALRMTPGANQDTPLTVQLVGVGDSLAIPDIAAAQTFASRSLGARITVPAGAFVRQDGSPATGTAHLQLTPWNVQSGSDLRGMPGNGRARDASGALVDLLSLGMMSVEFTDGNGQPLRLASGKTAQIQMQLPFSELNGVSLVPGMSIPMWHFDETQGLWIEEGTGTVQASSSSGFLGGLLVSAEVSHFSTWNWDMKFSAPGSVTVQCALPDGSAVACTVSADITLANGAGRLSRTSSVPATGTTIINMPTDATIEWQAYDASGYAGSAVSTGAGGTVTITIDPTVRTHHTVRCVKPDATTLPCKVDAYYYTSPTDFDPKVLKLSIPAEGAVVDTGFVASRVVFEVTQASETSGLNVTIFQGFVEPPPAAGDADIPLSVRRTYVSAPLPIRCSAQAIQPFSESTELIPIASCSVTLNGNYDSSDAWSLSMDLSAGVVHSVLVPPYEYGYANGMHAVPGQELPFFNAYQLPLPPYGSGEVLDFDFTQPLILPQT